jgi:hypothetical protein
MLLYLGKVKMNLTEASQGREKENPKRDRLHKNKEGEKEEHVSHFKTLICLAELYAIKEQL